MVAMCHSKNIRTLAASTQVITPKYPATSSKKLVGVDLACLFVIQNPEKHLQILQGPAAGKCRGAKSAKTPLEALTCMELA